MARAARQPAADGAAHPGCIACAARRGGQKQRSHRVYAEALRKNQAQIAARLRHPAGQLALLNPAAADRPAQPLRPLVLPFAALDFDDRNKALQAVDMAGCALQYPGGQTLCVAVGSNPYAGGFVYLVATFAAGELIPRSAGDLQLVDVHRAVVDVDYRGQASRWVAPYELSGDGRGRLTGYAGDAPLAVGARPVRDFRGWLWQDGRCIDAGTALPACARRSTVSVRQPVDGFDAPLQSLMALHGTPGDPAARYINRMQQAVRVLYGQASPSEAFAATTLALAPLNLDAFLGHVAANAHYIGIEDGRHHQRGQRR